MPRDIARGKGKSQIRLRIRAWLFSSACLSTALAVWCFKGVQCPDDADVQQPGKQEEALAPPTPQVPSRPCKRLADILSAWKAACVKLNGQNVLS